MKYYCDIEDTKTGETRRREAEWPHDPHGLEFYWTDGNMGCDCNRSMEFARAGGASDEDAYSYGKEVGCSSDINRFRVGYLALDDGSMITVDGAIQA